MSLKSLFEYNIHENQIRPNYLNSKDHFWLELLKNEYERFSGKKWLELKKRLKEPMPFYALKIKLHFAQKTLNKIWKKKTISKISPKKVREVVFSESKKFPLLSMENSDHEKILSERAKKIFLEAVKIFKISITDIEKNLFGDIPNEQILMPPKENISISELALRVNLSMAQKIISGSSEIKISLEGNARNIIKQAKLKGLICSVYIDPMLTKNMAELYISGPISLFKKTKIYARALGELIPMLAWSNKFKLEAKCFHDNKNFKFIINCEDQIFPGKTPKKFDSALEENFYKNFLKSAPDWDIIREPVPLVTSNSLLFPDFCLKHRRSEKKWFLEIIGFWTPDYLETKINKLKEIKIRNFILCINKNLNCTNADFPINYKVIWFSKNINCKKILNIINE